MAHLISIVIRCGTFASPYESAGAAHEKLGRSRVVVTHLLVRVGRQLFVATGDDPVWIAPDLEWRADGPASISPD